MTVSSSICFSCLSLLLPEFNVSLVKCGPVLLISHLWHLIRFKCVVAVVVREVIVDYEAFFKQPALVCLIEGVCSLISHLKLTYLCCSHVYSGVKMFIVIHRCDHAVKFLLALPPFASQKMRNMK